MLLRLCGGTSSIEWINDKMSSCESHELSKQTTIGQSHRIIVISMNLLHNHVMLYTITIIRGLPADSGFCSEIAGILEFPDSWCRQSSDSVSKGTVTAPRWGPAPGARWSRPSGPWTRPCAPSSHSPLSAQTRSWTWRSGPECWNNEQVRWWVMWPVTWGMSEKTMLDMVMFTDNWICFWNDSMFSILCACDGACAHGRVRSLTDTIPSQTTTCKSSTHRHGMRTHKSLSYSKLEKYEDFPPLALYRILSWNKIIFSKFNSTKYPKP